MTKFCLNAKKIKYDTGSAHYKTLVKQLIYVKYHKL